jgi:hypothetical protein
MADYDTLDPVECVVHEGRSTRESCSVCRRPHCASCLTYEVSDRPACHACVAHVEGRSRAFGSALLLFVSVGYLATLAIGYTVLRGRPFVGGLAAVAAILIWRTLLTFLYAPDARSRRD